MNNTKLTKIADSGMKKFNIASQKEVAIEQLKTIQKELANIGKEYKLNVISKLDNFRGIAKALQALRVHGVSVLTLEEIEKLASILNWLAKIFLKKFCFAKRSLKKL